MSTPSYLLQEDEFYLLQENNDKIILDSPIAVGISYMRSKQQTHAFPMHDADSGIAPMRSRQQDNPLPMEDEGVL
jgi:hypothetical protein